MVALFWAGAGLTLLVAIVYASILAAPGTAPAPGLDPAQVRGGALVAAALAAGLFAIQVIAAVGLTAGRAWARTPATLACVGWALTCVGLPVSILVLARLWRPAPGA